MLLLNETKQNKSKKQLTQKSFESFFFTSFTPNAVVREKSKISKSNSDLNKRKI